ncbi:LicD family protein [Heyndrickxia oleronia]|uniref:LicD family protein n=1 Tax=Heyndrickxia oleronia TaxID=38875 RepID=UPI002041FF06|nr:LicD family protein [Heyndrickxia oleronia]MCM3238359.1 LicD family protein [Heyndrickxia oleronia]
MKAGIDCLELNDEQLKKLQQEMLSLLIEVDRICKKNNIKYFLSYGTLIGAIRHKGFIPWDDDIDIEMFREDYEKFCKVCKSELNKKKFFLQNQQTDKNYNWVYGKLKLKNTSFVRFGQEHLKQKDGIFIDIFPLDNISQNKFKQKLSMSICKTCRKLLWAPVGVKSANTKLGKLLYYALAHIPRSLTIFIYNFFAQIDNNKKSGFLVSHNYFSGYIFKKEWYEEIILVEFEGHTFYAPKGYHNILSYVYGDYLRLPSEEERKGHTYSSYIKFSDGQELKL